MVKVRLAPVDPSFHSAGRLSGSHLGPRTCHSPRPEFRVMLGGIGHESPEIMVRFCDSPRVSRRPAAKGGIHADS